MKKIYYGLNPPRFAGSTVYYRNIIIFTVEDEKILGAEKFYFNGSSIPVSILDYTFDSNLASYHTSLDLEPHVIDSISRTMWLFDTKEEAIIQKFIMLSNIRKYFIKKQEIGKQYMNSKIPDSVDQHLQTLISQYPEVML